MSTLVGKLGKQEGQDGFKIPISSLKLTLNNSVFGSKPGVWPRQKPIRSTSTIRDKADVVANTIIAAGNQQYEKARRLERRNKFL